jgi:hypothetical protein
LAPLPEYWIDFPPAGLCDAIQRRLRICGCKSRGNATKATSRRNRFLVCFLRCHAPGGARRAFDIDCRRWSVPDQISARLASMGGFAHIA